MPVKQISPSALVADFEADTVCLLDVRDDWELQIAALDRVVHIPMDEVPQRLEELSNAVAGRHLVVVCRSGARSMAVANFLNQQGFEDVSNLDGGILAWSEQVDPSIPRY